MQPLSEISARATRGWSVPYSSTYDRSASVYKCFACAVTTAETSYPYLFDFK